MKIDLTKYEELKEANNASVLKNKVGDLAVKKNLYDRDTGKLKGGVETVITVEEVEAEIAKKQEEIRNLELLKGDLNNL